MTGHIVADFSFGMMLASQVSVHHSRDLDGRLGNAGPDATPHNPVREDRRILIVEDDPTTLRAWAELLPCWGYTVDYADNPWRALVLIDEFRPHIMLLDLILPLGNGFDLLNTLKRRSLELPTIVISAVSSTAEVASSAHPGVYHYLRKPVDPRHLRTLIDGIYNQLRLATDKGTISQAIVTRSISSR